MSLPKLIFLTKNMVLFANQGTNLIWKSSFQSEKKL